MDFHRRGYTVVDYVISEALCEELIAALPIIDSSGTRLLLELAPFRQLAPLLRANKFLAIGDLVAVECIFFRKSSDHNWSVNLHRDSVLPMRGYGEWPAAGVKEGLECVTPPREFLDRCLAVRVHLDGAPVEDISVIPGSHLDTHKHDRSKAVAVKVGKCGALVFRPTLAHASSRLRGSHHRRVLHYVFGPKELPYHYSWHAAA